MEEQALIKTFLKEIMESERASSWQRHYYRWKKAVIIYNFFKKEIGRLQGQIKVVDIGCGIGSNIFSLYGEWNNKKDIDFYGLDINTRKIQYCQMQKDLFEFKKIFFSEGRAEKTNFPDNHFDILFCLEVIEHLPDQKRIIREFNRILKPDGLAIITTPNKNSFAARCAGSLLKKNNKNQDRADCFSTAPDTAEVGYGHIAVKTASELKRIFYDGGFRLEKIKSGSIVSGLSTISNQHRMIFVFAILLELILDYVPIVGCLSEDIIVSFRKIEQSRLQRD